MRRSLAVAAVLTVGFLGLCTAFTGCVPNFVHHTIIDTTIISHEDSDLTRGYVQRCNLLIQVLALRDERADIRVQATHQLGRMGLRALPAIWFLELALQDEAPVPCAAAAEVIRKILGKAG